MYKINTTKDYSTKKPMNNEIHRFKEVTGGFEPPLEVLQTCALPLGYVTKYKIAVTKNDSDENRTRVTAVKGRCLDRLTTEPKS